MDNFYTRAKGKFLITGEYFVLDGAEALALPLRFGQSLEVKPSGKVAVLQWEALDETGQAWFSADFQLPNLHILRSSDEKMAATLLQMLHSAQKQNADFLKHATGLQVRTQNDFPRQWGLGTSSTLIAALARWAEADPYRILSETLGGSGYDIACAYAESPVLYRLQESVPKVTQASFDPVFHQCLYFIYLGQKQDSREGIRRYRALAQNKQHLIQKISRLTQEAIAARDLYAFDGILNEHEHLVAEALHLQRAKALFFSDFWGSIKSLGAWGGDFVLATSDKNEHETKAYFEAKGYPVVLNWSDVTGQSNKK
jgi:mevalonate kinase